MTKTLLLADDSVVIQKLVGLSFANEAITLITTDNGEDAVARAREAHPDLVLADVVMPGRNGYEVCEAIKQDPELADIPVLLLTGTFEAFDEERAKAVGSNGHITKPFEAQVLVDRVNSLLESPPAAAAKPSATAATEPMPAIAEDAYEFFDEEPLAVATPQAPPTPAAPTPAAKATTAIASADDDSFSFGNDEAAIDSSPSLSGPDSEPGGDRTVAMMPPAGASGARPGNTVDFDDLGATVLADEPPAAAAAAAPDPGATLLVDDPFGDETPDFSFDDEADDADVLDLDDVGAPSVTPPREDTLLADDLFGDSASGLSHGNPTDPSAITPATPVDDLDFDDDPSPLIDSDSDFGVSALEDEDVAAAALGEEAALESVEPIQDDDLLAEAVAGPEPTLLESEPDSGADSFRSVDDDDSEIDDSEPEDSLTGPFGGQPVDLRAPAPELSQAPDASRPSLPDLSPMLRDRLHESLEKIAWEAFADLSDTIVKQVLERVESVAWEIIPQMAEALIQEEIRRMKGDGED